MYCTLRGPPHLRVANNSNLPVVLSSHWQLPRLKVAAFHVDNWVHATCLCSCVVRDMMYQNLAKGRYNNWDEFMTVVLINPKSSRTRPLMTGSETHWSAYSVTASLPRPARHPIDRSIMSYKPMPAPITLHPSLNFVRRQSTPNNW